MDELEDFRKKASDLTLQNTTQYILQMTPSKSNTLRNSFNNNPRQLFISCLLQDRDYKIKNIKELFHFPIHCFIEENVFVTDNIY